MAITVTIDGKSIDEFSNKLENAMQVTAVDMLYALNRQKARIVTRTLSGVDLHGASFAPYSTKGPYYYYPNGPVARKGSIASRKSAAGRFAKKVGGARTRLGIKYESYAAFKAALGRSVVDLTGPRAPHMLQSIQVKTTGPTSGVLGIYGPEADRAEGHNLGSRYLPKREFFGFSDSDERAFAEDIETLVGARMDKL